MGPVSEIFFRLLRAPSIIASTICRAKDDEDDPQPAGKATKVLDLRAARPDAFLKGVRTNFAENALSSMFGGQSEITVTSGDINTLINILESQRLDNNDFGRAAFQLCMLMGPMGHPAVFNETHVERILEVAERAAHHLDFVDDTTRPLCQAAVSEFIKFFHFLSHYRPDLFPPLPPTPFPADRFLDKITESRDIRFFGFGEFHPNPNLTQGIATPLWHFATTFFPQLIRNHGVTCLIAEFLSPAQNTEVEALLRFGHERDTFKSGIVAVRQNLARQRGESDALAFDKLMENAATLRKEGHRFQIVGSAFPMLPHMSHAQWLQSSVVRINETTLETAQRVLSQGGRVVSYNGVIHTHPNLPSELSKDSFVGGLSTIGVKAQDYRAITVLVSDYTSPYLGFREEFMTAMSARAGQPPTLISRDDRDLIVYPKFG